ncbi:TetR/AcrR family transcriptional regulator C-terminal domain-containing protein [Kocuria marina]|uniref:TetR/AcrR family transcriptional regulator C-terminal domain-containing protein n=1 Tax=Kocuria marina TaxID=223184 RepID=UPI0022E7B69C|nr:TetR/AcrR family transcriptional regulator C-terminal domain-containing protein [Kocuria marina]
MSYWDHRKPVHRTRAVDDLFDLGLDHALGADPVLGADPAMRHAVDTCELTGLMLAYHAHLTRHGWACLVIGMRAPRGPHYLRLSERMIVLLDELGAPDPLGAAYTLANFTLGSALTQPMAPSERAAPVDAEIAPRYARLHTEHPVDIDALFRSGLTALIRTALTRDDTDGAAHGGARQASR